MAGGGAVVANVDGLPAADYGGRLTLSVLTTCLVAASGGLIFGYDIGISGEHPSPSSFFSNLWGSRPDGV